MGEWAYYNDTDRFACEWLRRLIAAGHIAPGEVDERDIRDINPDDVRRFAQCHFFAGIGVWSYALRLAGWPDERPVWTGSCPCQPFSSPGKREGFADERHLWPAWHWLIQQCRPPVVLGEQVTRAVGVGWLDLVSSDLEALGYSVGAADIPAAGVGAPHIRQRLYFGALDKPVRGGDGRGTGDEGRTEPAPPAGGEDEGGRLLQDIHAGIDDGLAQPSEHGGEGHLLHGAPEHRGHEGLYPGDGSDPGTLADPQDALGRPGDGGGEAGEGGGARRGGPGSGSEDSGMGDPGGQGLPVAEREALCGEGRGEEGGAATEPGTPPPGPWGDPVWVPCRDGRLRPVQRSPEPMPAEVAARLAPVLGLVRYGDTEVFSPLVEQTPNRRQRLSGYGNSLCAPQAAGFIRACMDVL